MLCVKLAKYLLINIYLPCVGTRDRLLLWDDIFENPLSCRELYPNCECIIAGDFKAGLNDCVDVAEYANSFISFAVIVRLRIRPTYLY